MYPNVLIYLLASCTTSNFMWVYNVWRPLHLPLHSPIYSLFVYNPSAHLTNLYQIVLDKSPSSLIIGKFEQFEENLIDYTTILGFFIFYLVFWPNTCKEDFFGKNWVKKPSLYHIICLNVLYLAMFMSYHKVIMIITERTHCIMISFLFNLINLSNFNDCIG